MERKHIIIRVPLETAKTLSTMAEERGVSMNDLLNEIIHKHLVSKSNHAPFRKPEPHS